MYSDSFVIIYILHAYLHSRLDGWFDRLHCRRPCGTEGKGVIYKTRADACPHVIYKQ